jgi:hypothetical protein
MVEDTRIQEQLDMFQGNFDDAEKDWEEGEQDVYIKEVRFSDNFKDGILRVIFEVCGAEESNEMLETPAMFRITDDPKILRYLTKFCRKVGFNGKFDMKTLQNDMQTLEGVIFRANVKLSKGDDMTFVNVFPIRPVEGDTPKSETPF